MKVLLLIAVILGVFSPMESKLATFKIPTNYAAGDWEKLWDGVSKCVSNLLSKIPGLPQIPDPFPPTPNPEPYDIVGIVNTLAKVEVLKGKFEVMNIKISEFTKLVNNKQSYARESYDFSLPVSLDLDYEATDVVLINFIPLKGKGHVAIKLNLRAAWNLTYDESGSSLDLELESLELLSKPYVNITGLQDDEIISERVSRQLTGILDSLFQDLKEAIDKIVVLIRDKITEEIGLPLPIETIEDLIKFALETLFASETGDIMGLLDLCQNIRQKVTYNEL